MKNNINLLIQSKEYKESIDKTYMFLKTNRNLKYYLETNKIIKLLLNKLTNPTGVDYEYDYTIKELHKIITRRYGDKNELASFIPACDASLVIVKNDIGIFKEIVELFLKCRKFKGDSETYIQAQFDKSSQKSINDLGSDKIIKIAIDNGYKKVKNIRELLQYDFAITKYTKEIKNQIIPDYDFGSQNKDLDIIIKKGKMFYFLEAKHIKESGGAQDKQIKELIGLISQSKLPRNIGIIAFMDGIYSNTLLDIDNDHIINNTAKINKCAKLDNKETKIAMQRFEIVDSLHKNENNYWLNTGSLVEFLKDK